MARKAKTYVITVRGWPDVGGMNLEAVVARRREVEHQLSALRASRESLKAEFYALSARMVELRHERNDESFRNCFAGIGSPLHETIVARLDPATVAELEADAMHRLEERERLSAERRTKKAAGG